MSRASMRAGRSVSAVAAFALGAMGLAALPASADVEDGLNNPQETSEATETPAPEETTTEADDPEDSDANENTDEPTQAPGDEESDATDEGSDAPADESDATAEPTADESEPAQETAKPGVQSDDDDSDKDKPAAQADEPITLDIVAISDFHGHIENAPELDNIVKGIKEKNSNYTAFIGNGDLVGGSAYVSAIDKDAPTMEILSSMGLEVSAAGNHEFDKGYEDFQTRIVDNSSYEYTAANVSGANWDSDAIAPYRIKTYGTGDDAINVGYVGAVTDKLKTLVSPDGIEGLKIADPIAAVDRQAKELKDSGQADVVIAMIHETEGVSAKVGPDVDAVLAGHTHHVVKDGQTPSGAPAIETGEFGQNYGHFKVTVDGDDVTATADVVPIREAYCADDPIWDSEEPPAEDAIVDNAQVCESYLAALAKSEELGKDPVGYINGGADRATNDGTDLGANRGSEMTASNLIAQAFYEYSQSMDKPADFGIMNPGGVRAEIDDNGDGTVTLGESFSAQPFANTYGTVDITGAQVYTMLEQQWADESTQDSRPILALGLSDSINFTYEVDADFGHHVKQVFIDNKLVDPKSKELYTVTSNAFLLDAGDGFNVFADGVNYNDTGTIDNEVFNEFLGGFTEDDPYDVDYSQRNIAISGEDTLMPGETTTIDLASLSMTYEGKNQPLPETAEVSLLKQDDAPIQARAIPDALASASADIDNTVTPNLNETGQATVELEVPDVEEGYYALVVEAGPTTFQVPGVYVGTEPGTEPTDEPTSEPTDNPTDEPTDQPTAEPTQPGEELPNTGANVAGVMVLALALVAGGGTLVARRKAQQA